MKGIGRFAVLGGLIFLTRAAGLQAQSPAPTPVATLSQTCPPPSPHYYCPHFSVTYPAGWNLLGITSGTVVTGTDGPLYTFRPGDSDYEVVTPDGPIFSIGYWAHFSAATTETLGDGDPIVPPCPVFPNVAFSCPWPPTRELPAGQFVMVGDPFNVSVGLTGADAVYIYEVDTGMYKQASGLQPGQGAWAYSAGGGTLTLTPTTMRPQNSGN